MHSNRKLIEVSLPLEAINQASVYEKFIRMGHPNVLHQWWSRKPLSAARGVLFASIVDDPSEYMDDEKEIIEERERLFHLIDPLVQWENIDNQPILDKARLEMARSVARQSGQDIPIGKAAILEYLHEYGPVFLDPFAGGGSIPLEAQRLGLRTYASDLNPVAVLINKAMLEIPGRFRDQAPVGYTSEPDQFPLNRQWRGVEGLAADLRHYGTWMQQEAEQRIGWLYPKIKLLSDYGETDGTIVAWLWVRTVQCPNPACGTQMPLASKWDLSKKKGKEVWVEPLVDRKTSPPVVQYTIGKENGKSPERTSDRRGARCIACETPVALEYIREEGKEGRLIPQLIAIALKSKQGRVYLPPSKEQVELAKQAEPNWVPDQDIVEGMSSNVASYGFTTFGDLFTSRQLVALNTLADLLNEVHDIVRKDALIAGMNADNQQLSQGGKGALAYADAVVTYLAFAYSKTLNRSNAFVPWGVSVECPVNLFSRQLIPFIWDFAESNVISGPSGSFSSMLENTVRGLEKTDLNIPSFGHAFVSDAVEAGENIPSPMISTDPPYYDMIPYAELSDFFYVWLRKLLSEIYPDLFETLMTPKSKEMIADANRAGGADEAKSFF